MEPLSNQAYAMELTKILCLLVTLSLRCLRNHKLQNVQNRSNRLSALATSSWWGENLLPLYCFIGAPIGSLKRQLPSKGSNWLLKGSKWLLKAPIGS